MTLVGAVQSLGIVESAAVSWISIRISETGAVARFMMALLLPFADPDLPRELRAGDLRFWPDQIRLLDTEPPIEEQIRELKSARLLGDLAYVYLRPTEEEGEALWIIETHAGSREERSDWIRSVIEMEGRTPR